MQRDDYLIQFDASFGPKTKKTHMKTYENNAMRRWAENKGNKYSKNQPYPSESKETTINRILLNPCLVNLKTRRSKSRALDTVQLKLRQPLSKHSTLTDLPQDFKKLVLESQNMLWTRRMHMKSDEIWWNWFSVGRFPCREVSGVFHAEKCPLVTGVFHAEKSRCLQYLISAGRKWERTGRYTNTKSDGSWAISKSSINVNNTTFSKNW